MRRRTGPNDQAADRNFVAQIILPTTAVVIAMASLLAAFVVFTAQKADEVAAERQQHLIAAVLEQNFYGLAHEQEAGTVWAVRHVRAPKRDLAWVDDNLGIWMHSQYGHDDAFILDGGNQPIYAVRGGRRAATTSFDPTIAAAATPLILELREKLLRPVEIDKSAKPVSPGAVDLGTIHGHPAILSVKPILSDSGTIIRVPAQEFLLISIRYLDGPFIADIAHRYELENAHFSKTRPSENDERSIPLMTQAGHSLGYFAWSPFKPGTLMLRRIWPALLITLLFVTGIVSLLMQRIRRSAIELSAANAQAQHLAFHDPLTGLANRAMFDDRLTRDLARIRQDRGSVALLFIDLDHFKKINDSMGHPTGDQLIIALAALLVDTVRPNDLVARIGGDEFAVIHMGKDARADAEMLCQRILDAVGYPIDLAEGQILSSLSIGVAIAPGDAIERIELVRKADIALYDAKTSGRRCRRFFTDAMDVSVRHRMMIETELRMAMIAGNQLEVHYQPFFHTQSMDIAGVEALVRWNHPDRGMLLPSDFVPIAEECGLIEPLGEWVLEQACIAAANWPVRAISVNVSPVQLRNPGFANRVFALLKSTRLDPTRLELEITETSFIESTEQARINLGQMRDIGVKMALDDFGTGYSSFKHLHNFLIDRLKIDQSFVSAIDLSKGGSAIIRAIVDLARTSGLKTTAEGVETEEQRQFLSSIGCHMLQGYLFSRPLRREEIDRLFLTEKA